MATASGIRAGKAFIELSLNDSKFINGLQQAERRLTAMGASVAKFGAKLTAIGAAVSGPILAFAKEFSDYGDSVQKAAIRTGLTTEAISELGFAAAQSGTDIDTFEAGIRGMQRQLFQAGLGSKEAVDTLEALGLTLADIQGMNVEDQFTVLAEAISHIRDDSQRGALAMRIFGRSGQQLLPLMSDGAKGVAALREEARQLGLSITQGDADAAAELNDAWGRLTSTFKAARVQIGAAVAPLLTAISNSIAKNITNVINWAKENRGLIKTVFLVGAGVAALGTAIVALGGVIAGVGAALGTLATVVGAIGAAIGVLLSPIGLVVAGIAALGVAAVKYFGGFGTVVEWITGKVGDMGEVFGQAIEVIKTALASGDITTAAQVFWAGLQLVWAKGVQTLSNIWAAARNYIIGVWIDTVSVLASTWVTVVTGIQDAWTRVWGFIQDAFDLVKTALLNGFLLIGQGVLTVLGKIQAAFDFVFGTNFANNIDDAKRKLEELRQVANEQFVNRVGERDQARRDRIEELSKAKDDTLAELERERQRRQGQLAGAGSEAVDEAQRKLDEAFAAYRNTVDEAARKQAATTTPGLDDIQKKQQDALANIFEGLDETAAATPSRASETVFGGARAAQIFGDVQDAQLSELKGIRQTLRDSLSEQKKKQTGLVITS